MVERSTCFNRLKLFETWEITAVACSKRRISLWKIHGNPMQSTCSKQRTKLFPFCFSLGKLAGFLRPAPDPKLITTIQPFRPLNCISSDETTSDRLVRRDFPPRLFSHSKAKHILFVTILSQLFSIGPVLCSKVDDDEMKGAMETEKGDSSGKGKEDSESIDVINNLTVVNQRGTSANKDGLSLGSVSQEQEPENHQAFCKDLTASDKTERLSELGFEPGTHNHISPGGNGLECTDFSTMDTGRTECIQSIENQKESGVCSDNESLGLDTLFDEKLVCSLHDTGRTMQSKANFEQRKREKRKRKRQLKTSSEDGDTDVADAGVQKDHGDLPQEKKKPKKIQPNYFLAIRVHNPQIHAGVKIIHDSIATHNQKLKPAFVSLPTLHITLMVMHLADAEEVQKAENILHQCKTALEPIMNKNAITLTFSGLDHFRHQVLYVKLDKEGVEVLKSVAKTVRETFTKEGIPSPDSREYHPHMTVMKLTGHNPHLRKSGIKKIPQESYASWIDMSFGEEPVKALHLCSMSLKDKDMFYKCMGTITFDPSANEGSSSAAGNA